MRKVNVKNNAERPLVSVKVIYSKNGSSGLRDAYRLLAKKLLEEKEKCTQQYISE
ncbi:MAG: hypothetical protein ACOY40_10180 [Bacillota bacterium]